MKSIKNNIVCITYPSVFSDRNTTLLLQEILDYKDSIKERNIVGIYISIKNVQIDPGKMKKFIEDLQELCKKIETTISIGEYRSKMFPLWRTVTKNTTIKLFKTELIAQLFLNPKSFKQKLKVLLLDDGDESEVERQSSFLSRFEHNIVYTNDKEDFEDKLATHSVDFAISQTKLNNEKQKKPENKPALKLSKNVILNLPLFIDTAVDNLVTMTGLEAQKTSHSIRDFNDKIDSKIVSAIMKFNGDIKGTFVLIFPKALAMKAVEEMLGEALEESDNEGISDGVAEFCNIITGSSKTKLQAKDINVVFELPKTFTTLTATKNFAGSANGIWIDMKLHREPFYMFITE